MTAIFFRCGAFAVAAIALLVPSRALAQIVANLGGPPTNGNDNVQAYFASQSDAFHASDPAGLPTWGVAGSGPYVGYAVPNVPGPPASPLYPSQLIPAQQFYSGPYTSHFTDNGSAPTIVTSTISAAPIGGVAVADADVLTNFTLLDPVSLYAYEQIEFAVDYGTDNALAGGIAGAPSFAVSGMTAGAGSYAQLAGQIDYWWQPVSAPWQVNPNPAAWIYLGALDYSWQTTGPGAFSAIVSPTGSLNATGAPNTLGVLELSGDIFVAGDPAQINVESVPEPSAMVLFGLGMLGLALLGRCRAKSFAGSFARATS